MSAIMIVGGAVALPARDELVPADIFVRDGVIEEVLPRTGERSAGGEAARTGSGRSAAAGKPPYAGGGGSAAGGKAGREILDVSGLLVLPGAIDPHVHFDDPGYTRREDFAHGTAGAACLASRA